jgi:hypothetical protein
MLTRARLGRTRVLCCAVLCCAVLCCAVLCCAVLCCAVLCCAVLSFIISPFIMLSSFYSITNDCTHGHTTLCNAPQNKKHKPSVKHWAEFKELREEFLTALDEVTSTPQPSILAGNLSVSTYRNLIRFCIVGSAFYLCLSCVALT